MTGEARHVTYTNLGGVGLVTLDRPAVRNAFGWQTWSDLEDALAAAASDEAARVIVVCGSGQAFSAGGDLSTAPARGKGVFAPAARLEVAQRGARLLRDFPRPTIAAVEGYAIGIGWSLVMCCDVVVMAEDAYFRSPFGPLGMVPDGGFVWLLSRRIGHHRAANVCFTGRRISAEEAVDQGLANLSVEPGTALDRARAEAERIGEASDDALRLTKQLLRAADAMPLGDFMAFEMTTAALALGSPETARRREARQPPSGSSLVSDR